VKYTNFLVCKNNVHFNARRMNMCPSQSQN
jgi:hypothetical protein